MDYKTANEKLGSRESRKLENNTYLQRRGEGVIAVKLHATDVLTFHADGRTMYDSGGWKTVTTKERMNSYGPLRIFTERGVWYTCKPGEWDKRLTYADGLTVGADGAISGEGVTPDERGDKRAIKKFVTAYLGALQRGEVPAPSGGDCWYCGMREVETLRPLGEIQGDQAGHIRGHFEEGYFVPSLLSRAMEVFGASQVCRQWVAAYWDTSAPEDMAREVKESDYYARHGREMCGKLLRRYLTRQLGYAA